MTRPFLSLGRVWLVRLAADQAFLLSARGVDWETIKVVEIILTVNIPMVLCITSVSNLGVVLCLMLLTVLSAGSAA